MLIDVKYVLTKFMIVLTNIYIIFGENHHIQKLRYEYNINKKWERIFFPIYFKMRFRNNLNFLLASQF